MEFRKGFTLIELLVVIAIIAILAVVVVLTLNPAELLRQSRDANRVSDMATLTSALNLYTTDQGGASSFFLGNASNTYISISDPAATSTNACGSLGLPSLSTSTGQAYQCSASSTYRNLVTGWVPVNFNTLTSGSPIGNLPVDPTNQTSSGLFYAYNTNGSQFQITAILESQKYKTQYGTNPITNLFPEVISGGTPGMNTLYNPNGLVLYWPMNEGSGSSTIDGSGNGYNGTFFGSATGNNNTYYTSGKVGAYAGDFDGSTNYLQSVTSTFVIPSQGSFTMWLNPPVVSTSGFPQLMGFGRSWFLEAYGGTGKFSWVGSAPAAACAAFPANTWGFIAATWTSTTNYLYENGVQCQSASFSYSFGATSSFNINSNHALPLYVDDIRFYNRTLSAAEIAALYNAEK